MQNPFRCFNSSPEVIRLAVMMCIRYPLSLRQVEDILFELASNFATRLFGTGGTGSVRCSPVKSGNNAFIIGRFRNGGGVYAKDAQTKSPPTTSPTISVATTLAGCMV